MHGGGWTLAPVWLKDLRQLRPCLLYICIARFHAAAGNYRQASQLISGLPIIWFPLGSSSPLKASGRGRVLIGNHIVWLNRIGSDQYLATGPPAARENTWDVCNYSIGRRGLNAVWNSENKWHFTLKRHDLANVVRRLWNVARWSVPSWIILVLWKANLLTKIITFGSMPWSGQLCNFTNSSWWKVDLKRRNYTHLSCTSPSRPLMLKKVESPERQLKNLNYHGKL